MVIKSYLVPGFRHFEQLIAFEHFTDDTPPPCGGDAEIVRQLKLFLRIAPGAYQSFHNLNKDSTGIMTEVG